MNCKLCLEEKELNNSHIIPKFVVKWLKETSATGFIRQGVRPNLRKQDASTEKLLCGECENLISQWETKFAESIYYPYVTVSQTEFEYNDWLLRFSVSLIWRLGVAERENFKLYRPTSIGYLDRALSVGRRYLLSDSPMRSEYGYHLLFLDYVESINGGSLPEGFHWYSLRSVDGALPANDNDVYGYIKLPKMVFFSGIMPKTPSGFYHTRIHQNGVIRASNQEVSNPVFGEFFMDRAMNAWEMTKGISDKQQEKIQESTGSNPEKSIRSLSYQVFLAEEFWKNNQTSE